MNKIAGEQQTVRPVQPSRFLHIDFQEEGGVLVTSQGVGSDPTGGYTTEELATVLRNIAEDIHPSS